jgi:hypothetical protein
VRGVDAHRRALIYLLAEYLLEFFDKAYSDRSEELFVVQRHPAQLASTGSASPAEP